jgi:6-phosphogluconolactonase
MNLVAYPDRELLFLSLADRITAQLGEFLRRDGHATLALPGGTTPGPVFDILSGVDLDWPNITVVPTDERWVGPDDARSNGGQIARRLLRGKAASARLVPLATDDPAPEDALDRLAATLMPHLPVSVMLLGMGEDLHVASLFPGGDRLAEALSASAPPLLAMRAAAAAEPRVTLTAPVLRGAMHVHLLILGPAKRDALERAAGMSDATAPVRVILDNATVHWAD